MEYRVSMGDELKILGRESWNALTMQSRTPFYEWEWLAPPGRFRFYFLRKRAGFRCISVSGIRAVCLLFCPCMGKPTATESLCSITAGRIWPGSWRLPYYPKLIGAVPATPSGFYSFFTEDTRSRGGGTVISCRHSGIHRCKIRY